MTEKSIFRKFLELTIECQTDYTRQVTKRLLAAKPTPVVILAILHIREDYNDLMADCHALLEVESLYQKIISN